MFDWYFQRRMSINQRILIGAEILGKWVKSCRFFKQQVAHKLEVGSLDPPPNCFLELLFSPGSLRCWMYIPSRISSLLRRRTIQGGYGHLSFSPSSLFKQVMMGKHGGRQITGETATPVVGPLRSRAEQLISSKKDLPLSYFWASSGSWPKARKTTLRLKIC